MENVIIKFKEMEIGRIYETYAMLESINQKVAKNGNCYVEIMICDGESCITARQFNTEASDLVAIGVAEPCVIRICLDVGTYSGKRNYNVTNIVLADDRGFQLEDFIIKAPIDQEKTFNQLIRNIKDSHVKSYEDITFDSLAHLTIEILNENKAEFIRAAAAKIIHHNLIGGLLYHSATMVEQAIKALETYPALDREILICGAALHDIGKLKEMYTSATGKAHYTRDGRLLGHSAIGIMILEDGANRLGNFNPERVKLIQHMIAAHHGQLEYGAITAPAIPEASVLHALDMIDSRAYVFGNAYKDIEEGSISDNIFALKGTSVYKPYSLVPRDKSTSA
jgi:3'-5' exoribonuclease